MPQSGPEPSLWIVAGANGSGKSTAFYQTLINEPSGPVWIINPDLLTARIAAQEELASDIANLEAVTRIERWIRASIDAHQSVGMETVLSTDKYRSLVQAAKHRGFRIRLVYALLRSVELNIERVAIRKRMGGHDVPIEKIRERRARSFAQLPWFLAHADTIAIFDNSDEEPKIVAEKEGGAFAIRGEVIPELQRAIDEAFPGRTG